MEVVQALDLMAKDRQAFSKDTSDPYAVFGTGENAEAFRVCININYKYITKLQDYYRIPNVINFLNLINYFRQKLLKKS